MSAPTLSLRQINRATLARQLLLSRAALPIPAAIEQVGHLQAQVQNPPYIGLWTRLADFQRSDLTRLMEARRVVRTAWLRSTLHLVTAEDYVRLRATLQPALSRALSAFFGQKAKGVDVERLVTAARAQFAEKPRTTGDLKPALLAVEPTRDPDALAYVVRTHLPLVQVPPAGTWGSGASAYTLAEAWLGQPIAPEADLRSLVQRYLAAFGPASIQDVQAWSGLTKLREPIEALRPALRTFKTEAGDEMFDLPDAPLPDADVPAPVRFMPEYDNVVLSHADRTRLIRDVDRGGIFLSAARVRATLLVDGFVRGVWKIEEARGNATLKIELFQPLAAAERDEVLQEGARLLRWVEDQATAFDIQIVAR
jgi:Winged helix DNA-binding domain